jgi:hypothetical protein
VRERVCATWLGLSSSWFQWIAIEVPQLGALE